MRESLTHSPGPWAVSDCGVTMGDEIALLRETGRRFGVGIRSAAPLAQPFPWTEGIANATLIAHAPEMLAMLRKVAAVLEPLLDSNELIALELEVDECIARATGRE